MAKIYKIFSYTINITAMLKNNDYRDGLGENRDENTKINISGR